MLRKTIFWLRALASMPRENQRLRDEVARLAATCDRLQQERSQWQELHREASAGYMASQELMLAEISRLTKAANIAPDPKLATLLGMYDDAKRHSEA